MKHSKLHSEAATCRMWRMTSTVDRTPPPSTLSLMKTLSQLLCCCCTGSSRSFPVPRFPFGGIIRLRSAVEHQKVPLTIFGGNEDGRGPVPDVNPSLTRRGQRQMFTLLICVYAVYFHLAGMNPAGKQTDATVVNILWPWDQLLTGSLAEQISPTGWSRHAYRAAGRLIELSQSRGAPLVWAHQHCRGRTRQPAAVRGTRPFWQDYRNMATLFIFSERSLLSC